MNAVRGLLALALLLAGCGGGDNGSGDGEGVTLSGDEARPSAERMIHETPEEAVKAMILGIVARDEEAIRGAIQPDPEAEILWAGDPPPPEELEPLLSALERHLTMRRLKPGDRVPLPGGQEHVLTEEALSEDQQLVVAERNGRPMLAPLFVHRTEDGWRVDAGPVIAAMGLRNTRLPGEDEPETPGE